MKYFNFLYKNLRVLSILTTILSVSSCKKSFLDIVPDNVATIDHAFANRVEAEKYLFTCYAYLPREGNPDMNPGFNAGDETWTYWPMEQDFFSLESYEIARGLQTKVGPKMNYWDKYDNGSIWNGIRHCNNFL